jgi:hypothetical protein
MIKLLLAGVVGLIFIFTLIIIIRNKPDIWFWIFLNLYFDPGGYISGFRDGKLVGPLNINDVIIFGIIICLVSAKINWKVIFGDKLLINFLLFLTIFSAYYFIVFGGVAPYIHNDFNYVTFLLKNREFIYGFFILISVYLFSLSSLNYFYSVTLFFGLISLSLYLITLFTGLELAYVEKIQREGTEMTRIYMLSYGLFDLVFPLSLIVYLISKKINLDIKYKHCLYYASVIFLITQIITLTRRTQIDILGAVIIISLIIAYLFRIGKLSSLLKLVPPAIFVIIVLSFTFPNYIGYMAKTAENTFLLITIGQDSEGKSDYRVSGNADLEITKKYINNNPLIGTGYSYLYWGPGYAYSLRGPTYSRAADAAGEVPIYYLLFGFGIIGAVLMLPLYFLIGKLFFRLIKLLRTMLTNYLQDPMTIIFSIYILLSIATMFTINFYNLSSHFTGSRFSSIAVLIGIGFALYRKIYLNTLLQNYEN